MRAFALLLTLSAPPLVAAFSSGGGSGKDNNGLPFLQSCDALTVCVPVCPPGMTAVAPPTRSGVYSFGTKNGDTSYEPDSLIPMEVRTLPLEPWTCVTLSSCSPIPRSNPCV